jgi:hypothetical protein
VSARSRERRERDVQSEIYRRRIAFPAAWTSAEIGGKEGLVRALEPAHLEALGALLARTRGISPIKVTRQDFDHPLINRLMGDVRHEIMQGKGAIILGGLDISAMPLDDFSRLYWGLGTHLGKAAVQNGARERLCHVRKEEHNPAGRGYLMDIELRSHTDFHEILSLASVRNAAQGGASGLVSSLAIHNVILDEAPHHLPALYEGFYHHTPGTAETPAEKIPVFCNVEGTVSCYFHPLFQHAAAKQLGVELPAALAQAQEFFQSVAARKDMRADFMLEPGEMMFWHNFTVLHSRTAFTDTAEQKRLLLRLWLHVPQGRAMHPSFVERAYAIDRAHEQGSAAIDYKQSGVLQLDPDVGGGAGPAN